MNVNNQAPEKRIVGDGVLLAVNSLFFTIQGEGPYAGRPAVFIRLAGCNLQCPLCDTEYSMRSDYAVSELVTMALNYAVRMHKHRDKLLVVITGGEPFRQPIGYLVNCLIDMDIPVQIETNGTLWQPGPWNDHRVCIVCSPKAGHINRALEPFIGAWKYVARADDLEHDGLPIKALDHPNARGLYRPPAGHPAPIYLQPADEYSPIGNDANMRAVVESCLAHGYRLGLQLHKIAGVP